MTRIILLTGLAILAVAAFSLVGNSFLPEGYELGYVSSAERELLQRLDQKQAEFINISAGESADELRIQALKNDIDGLRAEIIRQRLAESEAELARLPHMGYLCGIGAVHKWRSLLDS